MSDKSNKVNETLAFPLGDGFAQDLERALENGKSFAIAMVDVDRFDAVNKTFGGDEGDRVLIETGRYLKDNLPKSAALYRYGGDEFGILFGGEEEKEDVFLLLESMRRNYAVRLPDGTGVTFTVGIACAPDDAAAAGELIRKAEGAMYRGKLAGSDRVCFPREDKMVTKTTHYTAEQLKRLTRLSGREGIGEAVLLREALDALLKKYDV
ncbi:MAG TPA: diguanylate cyclase [Clostridia bacterium]|nr:diguanylate cyclase [Clostridia bacterium]